MKKGIVLGENVPAPVVSKKSVLIKVIYSCISAGTEMSGLKMSGTPLIKRALEQPDKIKKVINWALSDGIFKAYQKVMGEVESGRPSGYSLSGIVIGLGEDVTKLEIGDRVTASGGGIANHAEYVDVPVNLVTKIPQNLDLSLASTATLGAIALQGVRRADLKIGEFAVVMGAGILGLLTIQILKISGIRTAAIDIDKKRLAIAKELGAEIVLNPETEDIVKLIKSWSNGQGVDATLFTAATQSSMPLSQSFQMCRRKGRVILVGVSGMNIQRADMYQKELDFLISTSYGPGRYDKSYEEMGIDYPYAYVRWTENRNIQEYLRLLSSGQIELEKLISRIYPISEVEKAFESLKVTEEKPLIVLLEYGKISPDKIKDYLLHSRKITIGIDLPQNDRINVALIGTGNFIKNTHIPNLLKLKDKFNIYAIMNKSGYKAKQHADLNKSVFCTTDYKDILNDPKIDLILIGTRHDSHAELVLKALQAGKHVFVEKPLATNQEDLDKIIQYFSVDNGNLPLLMVGFNRRFSKYAQEIEKFTSERVNPLFIHYRMNAGFIPPEHWVYENGGRIIGEACHIIDLMTYFIKDKITHIHNENISPNTNRYNGSDNKSIILKYADGSVATINYFAIGNTDFPKEYMEIHFDEKTIVLDNYQSLRGYGLSIKEIKSQTSQKGHLEELRELHNTLSGENKTWPIELWDMVQTTETTFLI